MPTDGPWTLRVQGPAAPEEVWDRYLRPARWSEWSPQIRAVEHAGAIIVAGSTGTVRGPLGLRVPFEVLAVDHADPGHRTWTWVARRAPSSGWSTWSSPPPRDSPQAPAPCCTSTAPLRW